MLLDERTGPRHQVEIFAPPHVSRKVRIHSFHATYLRTRIVDVAQVSVRKHTVLVKERRIENGLDADFEGISRFPRRCKHDVRPVYALSSIGARSRFGDKLG